MIAWKEDPSSSNGSPARVGDLMRGRCRSPDLRLISYQDGGGTVCIVEGVVLSFLVALLALLTSMAKYIVLLKKST